MKVRWTERSVRLRISPPELERLLGGDEITASLALAGSVGWSVLLVPTDATGLSFQDGT